MHGGGTHPCHNTGSRTPSVEGNKRSKIHDGAHHYSLFKILQSEPREEKRKDMSFRTIERNLKRHALPHAINAVHSCMQGAEDPLLRNRDDMVVYALTSDLCPPTSYLTPSNTTLH